MSNWSYTTSCLHLLFLPAARKLSEQPCFQFHITSFPVTLVDFLFLWAFSLLRGVLASVTGSASSSPKLSPWWIERSKEYGVRVSGRQLCVSRRLKTNDGGRRDAQTLTTLQPWLLRCFHSCLCWNTTLLLVKEKFEYCCMIHSKNEDGRDGTKENW